MSAYSLVVKFLTPRGVEILRGDQATARSCYVSSLRRDTVSEALNIEEMDLREEKHRVSLVEELTQMILDSQIPDRVVNVDSLLEPKLRERLA